MAQDITQKAAKAMSDALADSRFNPNWFVNMVTNDADINDFAQQNLWLTTVGYLYNRALVHDMGMAVLHNQRYACEVSSKIVHTTLEPEYNAYGKLKTPASNVPSPYRNNGGLAQYGAVDLTGFDS